MNIENKKWLIGASGGPDSMALVKICLDKKINFAIATSSVRNVSPVV